MKYLQTKHEKNSAQITALITLIIVLLLFFVSSPPYTDPPEEYGVALNFGDPAEIQNPIEPSIPSSPKQTKVVEEIIEEVVEEEVVEEQPIEEIVEEVEELKEKAEEDLLTQEEEDALKIKEAKEKAEAELLKANAAKAKAQKEAKEKADALAKAASEKAAKEAKAKSDALAKAAADKAAKAKADGLAKAAAAKAASKFNAKESSPIYPGCQNGSLAQRESCTKSKLRQFLADNFNKELAGQVGLSGVQSIKIVLSIDNKGNVINSRALAKHPKLVEEVKRVVKLYPKLAPALQNGKPSAYNFSLSISIQTGK